MASASTETGKVSRRARQLAGGFEAAYPRITATATEGIGAPDIEIARVLQQLFPQLADMQRRESLRAAADQLGLMKEDISTLDILGRQTDPEYYATRAAAANAAQQLLQPGLTGGETAAIERSLGQRGIATGTQFTPSQTETVSRATTFGNAARDRFASALQSATALLPNLQKPNAPVRTIGASQVSMPNLPTLGGTSQGLAQGVLGQVGQLQNTGLQAALNRGSDLERLLASMPNVSL